jgi:Mg2+ and Co2+ transporter CorA
VVHSARWDEDRPQLREVDIVLGENFLITYHDGTSRSISTSHDVLPRRPELLGDGPPHLLHFILDTLVDHYMPIMDGIAERSTRSRSSSSGTAVAPHPDPEAQARHVGAAAHRGTAARHCWR